MNLSRTDRKRIEDKLRAYPVYRDFISRLPQEYAYRHLQHDYTGSGGQGSCVSDHTGKAVQDLLDNSCYVVACRVVAEVETVLEYLTPEEREAVRLTYFQPDNLTPDGIAMAMSASRAGYYNYRNTALEKLGIIL